MYRLAAIAAVAAMTAAALQGVCLGLAQDRDSAAIAAKFPLILSFHYQPSRSWGDPLYEIGAAILDAIGGITLVNLASALCSLVMARALADIVRPAQSRRALLGYMAAILNPLVLSNSSAAIETSLYLALSMLTTRAAVRYVETSPPPGAVGIFLPMGCMVLARPDSALFAIAISSCLVLAVRRRPAQCRAVVLGTVFSGLTVLACYALLNHGFGFLMARVVAGSSLQWRVMRASVGLINILGLPGAAALGWYGAMAVIHGRDTVILPAEPGDFINRLVLITLCLYIPRFFMLPDQLEYFIVPLTLFIIGISRALCSELGVACITLSLILNSIVHVSLFAREGGRLVVSPALNAGGVVQDFRSRALNQVRASEAFRAYVARSVYGGGAPPPALLFDPYLDGFASSSGDLIIGSGSAYQIGDPDLSGALRYRRSNYRHIYVCDADLAPRQGWRVMEPAPSVAVLDRFRIGTPLNCRPMQERSTAF
jgi:hypothetical protein